MQMPIINPGSRFLAHSGPVPEQALTSLFRPIEPTKSEKRVQAKNGLGVNAEH